MHRNLCVALVVLSILGPTLACGSGNQGPQSSTAQAATTNQQSASLRSPTTNRQRQAGPAPGSAWVIFGADTVVAEVASTSAQRAKGLMDRDEVPAGTGMLFVFTKSDYRSFWMKNTFVALDIAFISESFDIVDIRQLEPGNETPVESTAPASLALEVMQGWFGEHGIEAGQKVHVVFGPGLRIN